MKIAICDDREDDRGALKALLEAYGQDFEIRGYKLGSLKWQERADRIKQMILKHDEKQLGQNEKEMEEIEKKKSLVRYFVLAFFILVGYLESFHYLLPNVKEDYSVFFLPESIILKGENFLENVVFETDEKAIPCFYDLVHTNEASE